MLQETRAPGNWNCAGWRRLRKASAPPPASLLSLGNSPQALILPLTFYRGGSSLL